MTRFSANLGFLWTELELTDAIRAARQAGFDAVECHWPYDTPAAQVRAALSETGMKMLGLNTRRGNVAAGEGGLSALPGREEDARGAINEAIAYAAAIGGASIHVMAGYAAGPKARASFVENLRYACDVAGLNGQTVLIEPLNRYDAPGYFLNSTRQAVDIIATVEAANLKLMFDCYHVQLTEGDLTHGLKDLLPLIGHIQFAGVPHRGPPDRGEVAYGHIFKTIADLGYERPLGAEYRPDGPTEATLNWMHSLR